MRACCNQSPVLDMTLERELYAAAMAADEKLSARCEQRLHEASWQDELDKMKQVVDELDTKLEYVRDRVARQSGLLRMSSILV
ncbi:unnamed protein product [Microthlaspi erraticum]|uniref:Uncharacterized protein n=1 Tax=Microthlaspi erraticum TaxID=1685480 RepID=A0A6D2L017_9BRAS|nr:unnamed protein product [Microthlaspi erraticum]